MNVLALLYALYFPPIDHQLWVQSGLDHLIDLEINQVIKESP